MQDWMMRFFSVFLVTVLGLQPGYSVFKAFEELDEKEIFKNVIPRFDAYEAYLVDFQEEGLAYRQRALDAIREVSSKTLEGYDKRTKSLYNQSVEIALQEIDGIITEEKKKEEWDKIDELRMKINEISDEEIKKFDEKQNAVQAFWEGLQNKIVDYCKWICEGQFFVDEAQDPRLLDKGLETLLKLRLESLPNMSLTTQDFGLEPSPDLPSLSQLHLDFYRTLNYGILGLAAIKPLYQLNPQTKRLIAASPSLWKKLQGLDRKLGEPREALDKGDSLQAQALRDPGVKLPHFLLKNPPRPNPKKHKKPKPKPPKMRTSGYGPRKKQSSQAVGTVPDGQDEDVLSHHSTATVPDPSPEGQASEPDGETVNVSALSPVSDHSKEEEEREERSSGDSSDEEDIQPILPLARVEHHVQPNARQPELHRKIFSEKEWHGVSYPDFEALWKNLGGSVKGKKGSHRKLIHPNPPTVLHTYVPHGGHDYGKNAINILRRGLEKIGYGKDAFSD